MEEVELLTLSAQTFAEVLRAAVTRSLYVHARRYCTRVTRGHHLGVRL